MLPQHVTASAASQQFLPSGQQMFPASVAQEYSLLPQSLHVPVEGFEQMVPDGQHADPHARACGQHWPAMQASRLGQQTPLHADDAKGQHVPVAGLAQRSSSSQHVAPQIRSSRQQRPGVMQEEPTSQQPSPTAHSTAPLLQQM
jgi:hypothetical protein